VHDSVSDQVVEQSPYYETPHVLEPLIRGCRGLGSIEITVALFVSKTDTEQRDHRENEAGDEWYA